MKNPCRGVKEIKRGQFNPKLFETGQNNEEFSVRLMRKPTVLLSATMDLKLIYLSNFLKGVSDVIIMASAYAVASSLIAAKTRGRFFGIFNATFFLSWGLAGTLIVGPAADLLMIRGIPEVLSYRISFVLAAGVTFLGLVLMIFLISSKRLTPKASRSMVRAASP